MTDPLPENKPVKTAIEIAEANAQEIAETQIPEYRKKQLRDRAPLVRTRYIGGKRYAGNSLDLCDRTYKVDPSGSIRNLDRDRRSKQERRRERRNGKS